MLRSEPEKLPRQGVYLQPRADAARDPQKIVRIYLEYHKLPFTHANHRLQATEDAEELHVCRRLHTLLYGELPFRVLHNTLHGVPAPSDIARI